MNPPIPVIDLFAGPGGLGEGFSALKKGREFEIKLSIEMDEYAHQTLQLRSFFRQFPSPGKRADYYRYVRGEITRSELFRLHPTYAKRAKLEAWHHTLGSDRQKVRDNINTALRGVGDGPWVLIGGPPCQAYSVVGRSRMLSERGIAEAKRKGRSFDSDPRQLLYIEYLRVIAEHAPPVFVMENVRGLLSAKANGESVFRRILRDLENPDDVASEYGFELNQNGLKYRVAPAFASGQQIKMREDRDVGDPREYLVKAEEHGVPQARHRIILIGTRQSPGDPVRYEPNGDKHPESRVSVGDAISDLPRLRSRLSSKAGDNFQRWVSHASSPGRSLLNVGPVGGLTAEVISSIRDASSSLQAEAPDEVGTEFMPGELDGNRLEHWYYDQNLGGVLNHVTRSHMGSDLGRYFFAAAFASRLKRSPTLQDFPEVLMPDHASAGSRAAFADRFRVQVRDRPATTVTSHISKDGHAFIHYDESQSRSLTVREAARLQTFPDNYFFEGPRTSQYAQVGNAVPPLLAREIAKVVAHTLAP